jgi:WD40 repeat protein
MAKIMHPHRSKRPAARFAALTAAAALLSLTAALAQPPGKPAAPQKADKAEEEARRQEEAAKKAQERAIQGMKTSPAQAPVTFAPIVTDPEGITFGQSSTSLDDRLGGEITAVAFAPDGTVLAGVGSRPGKRGFLKLWDSATGKESVSLRQPEAIATVAFASDGKLLATGEAGGVLKLRDPATGKVRRTLGRHGKGVNRVVFAPDGKTLLSVGHDSRIRLWDVTAGKETRVLAEHLGGVTGLAFARDGKTLVSLSRDGTVRLWDWPAGKERRLIKGQNLVGANSLSVSPDGKTVALVSPYQPVRLWDTQTGKEVTPQKKQPKDGQRVFTPPANYLVAVYVPDGKALVATASDGRLILLDAKTLEEKGTIAQGAGFGGPVPVPAGGYAATSVPAAPMSTNRILEFNPDGKRLAAVLADDQVVSLWDVPERKHLLTLRSTAHGSHVREPVLAMACTRDGKTLALALEDHRIAVRDVASGEVLHVLSGHTDKVTSLAFASDGKTLASGSADNTVKIWDCAAGKELRTLRGHGSWVYAVAFAPGRKTVASGGYDRSVRLWDADTGQGLATLLGHSAAVRALAFAPDGELLASGGNDRAIKLWDTARRAERATLKTKSSVRALAFTPDGKMLASAGDDGAAHTWDVATGKQQSSFPGIGIEATALAFSPTGTRFAVTHLQPLMNVWPARPERKKQLAAANPLDFGKWQLTDSPLKPLALSGHGDGVMGVAFTPDGHEILTASYDRTVRLHPATKVPVRLLKGHTGWVSGAVFSPDGKYVLTCGGDLDRTRSLCLWDFATGKELRRFPTDNWVAAVAFAPDGRTFAAGMLGGTVAVYDATSGRVVRRFKGPLHAIRSVAYAPDGQRIVAGGDKGELRICDLKSGEQVWLEDYPGAVLSVDFAADGKRVLSADQEGMMRLWDADTGKQLRQIKCETAMEASPPPAPPAAVYGSPTVKGPPAKMGPPPVKGPVMKQPVKTVLGVRSALFLPDGKRAVCAEGQNLSIWDLESGKRVRKITGHGGRIDCMRLTQGGRVAVTASRDQTVRLWDLETGAQLSSLFAYNVPQAPPKGQPPARVYSSPDAAPPPPPPPAEPQGEVPAAEEKTEVRKETLDEAKKKEEPVIQEDAQKPPPAEAKPVQAGKSTTPPVATTPGKTSAAALQAPPADWSLFVAVSPDGRYLLTAGGSPAGVGSPAVASADNPANIVRVWRMPATPRPAQAGPGKQ